MLIRECLQFAICRTNPTLVRSFVFLTLLGGCARSPDGVTANSEKVKPPINSDSIYGVDNRKDIFEVSSYQQYLASSTVALMELADLVPQSNGSIKIKTVSYAKQYNLCSTEKFLEQETASTCSGFLVGPDLVATAGHCVENIADCANQAVVFDFAIHAPGVLPAETSESNVYFCKELVARKYTSSGEDYGLIRLDRAAFGRDPLSIKRTGILAVGNPVFVIGHPSGLPAKLADGAAIRKVFPTHYQTNLDTYGGNSGSAVFDANGEVVGILVRGEEDFQLHGNCNVSVHCKDTDCQGEDATRIDIIASQIPVLRKQSRADGN